MGGPEITGQSDELKALREELTNLQERLVAQENLAILGGMTAGIAHEIKNPLNFMNNFAALSQRGFKNILGIIDKHRDVYSAEELAMLTKLGNTLNDNLGAIMAQGERANSIIHRMLANSRSKGDDVPVLTDIHAMLAEFLNLAYHGMRSKDSRFNVKMETDFQASVKDLEVLPSDLSRVFLNLFNNAFYAVFQKQKELGESFAPLLTVSTRTVDGGMEIRIRDNGKGIPAAAIPKIFTQFFTTKPVNEGTGLGLSLSRHIIVEGHGGSLDFTSKEGEFTEFVIRLPLKAGMPFKNKGLL